MGKRKAGQQEIVQEILHSSNRPLLPAEILAIAASRGQRLGLATVYRALRNLSEAGEIVSVFIQNEAPRYEYVKSGHHHHFLCRKCHAVFDISGCLGKEAFLPMIPGNFRMDDHEITLHGVCAACAQH